QAIVKELPGKLGPDGVGGGELPTDDLADGTYSLEVKAATTGTGERLLPRTQSFRILRAEAGRLAGVGGPAPPFKLDRNLYAPGDKVQGEFYGRNLQNGAAAANQNVTITAKDPQ